nr:reverse transcriptase domain-containing protein [Tanacetum cinerariifolium]
MQNQLTNLTDLIIKFVNSNTVSTSSSGTLPSNTIANPKSDLKAITTRSGVSFPPSKTTSLHNEITSFQQQFDESFSEAWDRFKDLLRACPHHGQNQSPALVKAVEESCVTYGGAHSYRNYPAIDGNVYCANIQEYVSQAFTVNYNQGNTSYRPQMMSNQIRPPGFPPVPNDQNVQRNNQNRFIPNQNRAITTRSGVSYDGPQIPPPVVENEPEATKDTVNPTNNGNTEDVQPQAVQSKPVTSEPAIALVSASKPNQKASIPYPSRDYDERNRDPGKFLIPCDFPAGSESHPPMLNKENYVPWSSCLLRLSCSMNGKGLLPMKENRLSLTTIIS